MTTGDAELTPERMSELWRIAFGEPPAIIVEPAQMLALIEALQPAQPAAVGAPP